MSHTIRRHGEVVEILEQDGRTQAGVASRPIRFVTVGGADLPEPRLCDRVRIEAKITIESIGPDVESDQLH
ncbi:MAG: hypothetical protein U0527_15965 [Candidatus Eisenbacteria bacterium]